MNYEEYIRQIKTAVRKKDEKKLAELKKYKPESLLLCNAEVQRRLESPEDGVPLTAPVSGKYTLQYDYGHNLEALQLIQKAHEYRRHFWSVERLDKQIRLLQDDLSFLDELYAVCETGTVSEIYKALYTSSEFLGVVLFYESLSEEERERYAVKKIVDPATIVNLSFFVEKLQKEGGSFVLVKDEKNGPLIECLAQRLAAMGKRACIIEEAICEDAVNPIEIRDTLALTVENITQEGNIVRVLPIEIRYADGTVQTNLGHVLAYLSAHYGESLSVISSGRDAERMSLLFSRRFFRLTRAGTRRTDVHLAFSYYGEYMDYLSEIYGKDCREMLRQKPSVRFSVVIPARNSAKTLRHTVQTCLRQDYQGDYEIIISDNSNEGNTEVFDLCEKLDDPRIVYIRTPRNLHLPKSFEYAFLHTRGEYVLGLGSDDGVLPWALSVLDEVIAEHPEDEIVHWERGFYAWPGFNGGQQNQFVYPRGYVKNDYHVSHTQGIDYLAMALKERQSMYSLPMLYINSCFKRSYMQTLLDKTGRLWDGPCQDIYMGVVSSIINEKILHMEYPLTIAGMSSASVGAGAQKAPKTREEYQKVMDGVKKDGNVGGYCKSFYECLLPTVGTDTWSLYTCVLRCISIVILPDAYLNHVIDWKQWYLNLAQELDIRDFTYDRKAHEMYYCATEVGSGFAEWFEQTLYPVMMKPRYLPDGKEDKKPKRTYTVGRHDGGGLVLDASEYGVEDIEGAVELFAKIMDNGGEL